jgi:hypothetical protein
MSQQPTASGPQRPIDDVVIRFTRQIYYEDGRAFQAEVRRTPVLLRGGAFQADIEAQADRLLRLFANRVRESHAYRYVAAVEETDPQIEATSDDLTDLGVALYQLLPESLREGLPRLLQHALDKRRVVRIIFEARAGDYADRLLGLPWEILFFEQLRTYLGLMPRVLIVRRLLDTVRRVPVALAPSFNILHIIADMPKYPIDAGLQRAEREALTQVAGSPDAYTLVAAPGSVERVREALQARPYQVVHFLGHGISDSIYTEQGYLLFAGADQQPQLVTGEQFQHLLSVRPDVQLVTLNACHSASAAASAVAIQLVHSGIPFVIAIQAEMLQSAAEAFTKTFYRELRSSGIVELALASGRIAVAAAVPSAIDWSLPVVYTSVGVEPEARVARAGNQIERWLSLPAGKRQFGIFNLALGTIHLAVGLLLVLSGVTLALPAAIFLTWASAGLIAVPPLAALSALFDRQVAAPRDWRSGTIWGLRLRIFGAAALGVALPALYGWFVLILLVAFGFWGMLSLVAQIFLLAALFLPSILVSRQIALAHGRGFITNAAVEEPAFSLDDLVVVAAGYLILLMPLAALWLFPQLLAPPLGNVVVGLLLLGLGYSVRKDAGAPAES